MKFSDYIQKQGDEFRKAGDGYEALRDISKACIDSAVQRFIDEYAAKQKVVAFNKWCRDQGYYQGTLSWWYDKNAEGIANSTEELYDQFIKTK